MSESTPHPTGSAPGLRSFIAAYAIVAYGAFMAAALWAIGFLANRWAPTTVDGTASGARWVAIVVDLALLGLFAVHHSALARPAVKQRLCRVLPAPAERSTFVLTASLLLALLFWQWRPLPGHVWDVAAPLPRLLVWLAYVAGWAVVVASTFMVDHFDFLGLRPALQNLRRRPVAEPSFSERWLYRWVRHPMMAGLLVAFWATPTMSRGHLLFALASSAYIAVGVHFEERELRHELGAVYDDYAARVPALVPRRVTARARACCSTPAPAWSIRRTRWRRPR